MIIISENNIERTKARIKNSKESVAVMARDDLYNRKMLEYGRFSMLLSPEKHSGKDMIKQNDSGLNHVLAKIAAKNNISIGIDLDDIRKLGKKEKAIRFSKIRQNIKICRKARTRIIVLGSDDSSYLMRSLGSSSSQAAQGF